MMPLWYLNPLVIRVTTWEEFIEAPTSFLYAEGDDRCADV